jgi:LacI family transcriptional regulator
MAAVNKRGPVRPTIRAIAEMAGVSRTTVSLILANREDVVARFRPETVEKVRQAADSLGYRANLLALSLRSPRPAFFALILRGPGQADPDSVSWHHQAFEGMFLAGALEASRSLRLHPVVATQDLPNPDDSLQASREVLEGGVFGAVVRSPVALLAEPLLRRIEGGMPVVTVFPEASAPFPSNVIDLDNTATGRVAANLLLDAGRRRWLFLFEASIWEALRVRLDGIRRVASETGASLQDLTVPTQIAEAEVPTWLAARLKELRPDGIYAPSALSAVRAIYACLAAGLRIPEDICIVGTDSALWRARGFPSITSVDVSWYKAGELAVRKMTELRDSGQSIFESVYIPPVVHTGDSCPGTGKIA